MKHILSRNRHLVQRLGFTGITLMAILTVIPIVGVVIYILVQGAPAISGEFLTGFPHDGMRAGGILPAIVGTLYLTLGTAIFSVPLGIAAAINVKIKKTVHTKECQHMVHEGHTGSYRGITKAVKFEAQPDICLFGFAVDFPDSG